MQRRTDDGAVPFFRDSKILSILFQVSLCALILAVIGLAFWNALARSKIGFGFWNVTAGFDIDQTLIAYSAQSSTYGRAFWVGLLNTLLVSALGIVFATVLGFLIGIGRLSHNWLVARLSAFYVETIRNVPLLLQLLFWYNAVLKALPELRDSHVLIGGVYLSNRGLFVPKPIFGQEIWFVLGAFVVALVASSVIAHFAKLHRERTGQRWPVAVVVTALITGLPLLLLVATGFPVAFEAPQMNRFNVSGGIEILPEFMALLFGLAIYTAAFIAEVVRAGILAVAKGQTEAALALGLWPSLALRLIVIPQAMRVIIPPLTNQYLNLTKNSSLAVAIGYPDFVHIFTGTVLNQTGQAVSIVLLTMAVYLAISLFTSLAMNIFNARIALTER
ncbi:MAG: amino acid ABC transporter permease [Bradyrhizobiaceae bacterium]|nr:amino acid ABC transporter permease [Bradyrhizobiaceae bacterium]